MAGDRAPLRELAPTFARSSQIDAAIALAMAVEEAIINEPEPVELVAVL